MNETTSYSLILSCNGRYSNGVQLCGCTQFILADLSSPTKINQQVINFLDYTCHLFDSPEFDWNAILNIIKILKDKYKYFNENFYSSLCQWTTYHKSCGAILRIDFNSSVISEEKFDSVDPTN